MSDKQQAWKSDRTISEIFYDCIIEGREFNLPYDYILLVQSLGKYLAIKVDGIFDGGFLSDGVYYSMQFNFMAINEKVAKLIAKKSGLGAIEIVEEKMTVN